MVKTKKRIVEATVTIIFIGSLFLNLFFGFKYFAGYQYASRLDANIIGIITIAIYLCLIYYLYRFIQWLIRIVSRLGRK